MASQHGCAMFLFAPETGTAPEVVNTVLAILMHVSMVTLSVIELSGLSVLPLRAAWQTIAMVQAIGYFFTMIITFFIAEDNTNHYTKVLSADDGQSQTSVNERALLGLTRARRFFRISQEKFEGVLITMATVVAMLVLIQLADNDGMVESGRFKLPVEQEVQLTVSTFVNYVVGFKVVVAVLLFSAARTLTSMVRVRMNLRYHLE